MQENSLDWLYKNKVSFLENTLNQFADSSSIPKIGVELEFYLLSQDNSSLTDFSLLDNFIAELSQKIPENSLIYQIEKERGKGQVEVKTLFDSDLLRLCEEIEKIKLTAKNLASEKNLNISFAAQPFADDCGSALQFNISLHNQSDKNLFEEENKLFFNSIAGLLELTDSMLILLAPAQDDYLRFDSALNKNLHKKGKYTAPTNLSFGNNNRTTAIRIPRLDGKRIEYRIPAANADPYLSIAATLKAILYGIKNDLIPEQQGFQEINGNAFDEQYNLKSFAKTRQMALGNFKKNFQF